MKDDDVWDFYFCRIDDSPASIFFNESASERAPVAKYKTMVAVSIVMRLPRSDGLSSSEEFDLLTKIEDALEAAMLASGNAVYVGRATHDGDRDFYFYSTDDKSALAAAVACMADFPEYEFSTTTKLDPEWETYRGFLYPSERDRQRIENRKVCESLEQQGDNLSERREICHWAYFPSAKARDEFVGRVTALGFELRNKIPPDKSRVEFGASFARIDLAAWDEINGVTLDLFELAQEFGGDYDGWESPVVKPLH